MSKIKIGCLQMEIAKGDPEINLGKVVKHIRQAAEEGLNLLLLPEMWSTGFAYRKLTELSVKSYAILEEIQVLARENKLAVVGSLPLSDGDNLYNTMCAVGPDGSLAATYRKVHLFPLFKEDMFLERGKELILFDLFDIPVGLAICYDLRFPEQCRKLAIKGAKIILVSAQWPAERLEHWRILNRARALENQIFIAAANSVGRQGMTRFAGHSVVVDPLGEILAEGGDSEELVKAVIDAKKVDEIRQQISYLDCRVRDVDEFLTI